MKVKLSASNNLRLETVKSSCAATWSDCVYQYTPARLTDQQIAQGVLKRGAGGGLLDGQDADA